MLTRTKRLPVLTGTALFLSGTCGLIALPAHADYTIHAFESGNDVIFLSGGGSLDTSLWTFGDSVVQLPAVQADAALIVGSLSGEVDAYLLPVNFTGPASIGPGTAFHLASDGFGDSLGLAWLSGNPALFVPSGYQSGDPLTKSVARFSNHTFDSLGLAKGEYTWTWDTLDGAGDSFTIRIVPTPGAFALVVLAGFRGRRRRE